MDGDIVVKLSGLSGQTDITVPEGTTIADLRAQGQIQPQVGVRQAGVPVGDSTVLVNGGHYVTTPPAAKHG